MKQHYALVNPLSRIVDKAREDFTREDLIRVIEEQQIERITFHYTALDNLAQKLNPPFHLKDTHYPFILLM